MLVSRERQRTVLIDSVKVSRGDYCTKGSGWLFPHIAAFIRATGASTVVDPFAGDWDLLHQVRATCGSARFVGFDCAPREQSMWNDSLLSIPRVQSAIIVTNPPYLAKHSAKRKRVWEAAAPYFATSNRDDLYQIALDRCLEASDYVVAIVPETFMNSTFPMSRLRHATVIEESLFTDTDCPVCVVCFGPDDQQRADVQIYVNSAQRATLAELDALRLRPDRAIPMVFNDPNGILALRAIDLVRVEDGIGFFHRSALRYPRERIKQSSRLVTYIALPTVAEERIADVLTTANALLARLRVQSADLIFSPFKGNRHDGRRRRRLDYATARALLERAIELQGADRHGTQRILA